MSTAIVTGSGGLVGSAASVYLLERGLSVVGIDNDMRSYFFGESASTRQSYQRLSSDYGAYRHHAADIRDYPSLEAVFRERAEDTVLVIHTAAQPSHDWAAREPLTDFGINATGTLNLLELTRRFCPQATFVFTSTNKVYGDRPNLSLATGRPDGSYKGMLVSEQETRYEAHFAHTGGLASIDETMSVDCSKHSIFGASKLAADVMCQEYGRYFGMNVGVFRGGCLTGPNHASAEMHGFLSYLVKCVVHGRRYTVFGYKGKQVRDNIHSSDLVDLFWRFHLNPRKGEVYNIGGGRENSVSILEAIRITSDITGRDFKDYEIVDRPRSGDHAWYISDLTKVRAHYPDWSPRVPLRQTIEQMVSSAEAGKKPG